MFYKNYQYFISIVEEGSISKAAEKLYISQSSLSKYLKHLEENLGVELFSRESYPLKLTEAGKLYHSYVKDIIERNKRLLQNFSAINDFTHGKIVFGVTPWRSSILLPVVLPAFWQAYPNIHVEIREGSHKYMASLIDHDEVDFCIFHIPNSYDNITFELLKFERILFTVKKDNPLLKNIDYSSSVLINHMNKDDFLYFGQEQFILLLKGQNIRELTQNYLNKLHINPMIALETSNIVTAMNLVASGVGVTFVPESVLKVGHQYNDLVFFSIDDPLLQWELGIAYKTKSSLSKQSELFIDYIKKMYI
jgi:LysR family transcriptional regulator, transcription activator of glutamate synthase operon